MSHKVELNTKLSEDNNLISVKFPIVPNFVYNCSCRLYAYVGSNLPHRFLYFITLYILNAKSIEVEWEFRHLLI
jgi:hypothetical protein